jgi:DNA-binding NarL/FixJ family response regulator
MAQIARLNPALIVVDINLPDGTGLEIVDWVRELSETVAIVVLTFSDDDLFLMSALKSGASAFIKKSAPLHELIAAIKAAIAAPLSFSAEGVAQAISRRQESFHLSSRELQILSQLATDLSLA